MDRIFCSTCGFSQTGSHPEGVKLLCPKCGNPLKYEKNVLPPIIVAGGLAALEQGQRETKRFNLEFKGNGKEYFKIWIVNFALTLITCGIYAAWAKVRNRRYLFSNISLDGHAFDYVASPIAILKGNLIVGSGIILYFASRAYRSEITGLIVLLFYIVFPFLIFKALKFLSRNTVYRNIRFQFNGTLKESFKTYLLTPLLIPLTLGLITPYWGYIRKRFFFNNMAFGTTTGHFKGNPGLFYKYYVVAGFVMGCLVFSATMVFYFILIGSGSVAQSVRISPENTKILSYVSNGIFLLSFTAVQQVLYAGLTNHCWNNTRLGRVSFESTMKPEQLVWIRITNIFAIVLSLGLLAPWAKIRRMKYILSHLTVISHGDLSDFVADDVSEVSAVGESAADFFNFEIGL